MFDILPRGLEKLVKWDLESKPIDIYTTFVYLNMIEVNWHKKQFYTTSHILIIEAVTKSIQSFALILQRTTNYVKKNHPNISLSIFYIRQNRNQNMAPSIVDSWAQGLYLYWMFS